MWWLISECVQVRSPGTSQLGLLMRVSYAEMRVSPFYGVLCVGSGEAPAFKIIQIVANMFQESVNSQKPDLGQRVNAVIILLNVARFPSIVVVQFYISFSCVCKCPFPYRLTSRYIFGNLIDKKWFHSIVLFYFSHILSKGKHLFIWVRGIYIFSCELPISGIVYIFLQNCLFSIGLLVFFIFKNSLCSRVITLCL